MMKLAKPWCAVCIMTKLLVSN